MIRNSSFYLGNNEIKTRQKPCLFLCVDSKDAFMQTTLVFGSRIKISVIIPHYNRVEMVLECLDSIAANDYSQDKYEVILVDDCSTVDIETVRNYSKIRNYHFFKLETNSGGASVPRNFAIDKAAGKYILFIDSDDTISAGFMSKTIAIANKGSCDVVNVTKTTERPGVIAMNSGYAQFKTDTVIKIKDEQRYGWPIFIDHQITGRLFRTVIIKKHRIKFPEKIIKSEDRCFNRWFWVIAKTAGICVTEKYNLTLHDHPTAQLHKYENTVEDEFNMVDFLLQNIMPIPKKYASLDKKACVFHRWFHTKSVDALSRSPQHLALLKDKYVNYFKWLKESKIIKEKSLNFIDGVLSCK